jgi:hypothetical protein
MVKTNPMTLSELEKLKQSGKIKDYTETGSSKKPLRSKEATPSPKKGHKVKEWIKLNLEHWADCNRLKLETEYTFDTERQWRFDFAIPRKKLAFEYEGVMAKKSRHTTVGGYTGDAQKYNEAMAQGWRVFRYTVINHKDLLKDLNKIAL